MSVVTSSLKELGQIIQPKASDPKTCPSLQDAPERPPETVDSFYVTPSLRSLLRGLFIPPWRPWTKG
jgi:hypothetical protein